MNETQIPSASAPGLGPPRSQSKLPARILLAEDDSSLRELNAEMLIGAGYVVAAAPDGASAWQALNAEGYDLLLTDNNMPNLSGVELLKKLYASRLTLPVIMATGILPEKEFVSHPWLRPTATLLKPYTAAELLQTVQKVLRGVEQTVATLRPPARPATHRILVVDEDRDLRQMYAEALAGPGYDIDEAADGLAGWEALQAHPYDLLITEHDLPKLTGIEMVKKLRAAHMALPVIMATGRLPSFELAHNMELQFSAALIKPFPIDELLGTVKKTLRGSHRPGGPMDPPPNRSRQTAEPIKMPC